MALTEFQFERRRQRGEAMAKWIDTLANAPDDAIITITIGELKAIAQKGHAICGFPTSNFCGEVIRQLIGSSESEASQQAAQALDKIR